MGTARSGGSGICGCFMAVAFFLLARPDLAGAALASGGRDRAADELLAIIGRDREWNEGAARKRFLQLLEAQGLEDDWARGQRRRLSALLFT